MVVEDFEDVVTVVVLELVLLDVDTVKELVAVLCVVELELVADCVLELDSELDVVPVLEEVDDDVLVRLVVEVRDVDDVLVVVLVQDTLRSKKSNFLS